MATKLFAVDRVFGPPDELLRCTTLHMLKVFSVLNSRGDLNSVW